MSEPVVKSIQTRSGPMLAIPGDLYVGRALELYGEYCPDEGRLLSQLIKPGMTVVEIGANMGAHSVDLARACAPGRFYAFEPQPRLFQVLCANLALNDIANAVAYPEACGEAEGWATVPLIDYARGGNFGGVSLETDGGRGLRVRVTPLDQLGLARCDLIKIDVEGFEPAVLRGARQTIARCRPVLYVENDRQDQQGEVISLIAGLGYDLYWHTPRLYSPENFNGVEENIYPHVVSLNMLCLPRERGARVEGAQRIDPDNWTCPIRLGQP